jgi:hypothetical protein
MGADSMDDRRTEECKRGSLLGPLGVLNFCSARWGKRRLPNRLKWKDRSISIRRSLSVLC